MKVHCSSRGNACSSNSSISFPSKSKLSMHPSLCFSASGDTEHSSRLYSLSLSSFSTSSAYSNPIGCHSSTDNEYLEKMSTMCWYSLAIQCIPMALSSLTSVTCLRHSSRRLLAEMLSLWRDASICSLLQRALQACCAAHDCIRASLHGTRPT